MSSETDRSAQPQEIPGVTSSLTDPTLDPAPGKTGPITITPHANWGDTEIAAALQAGQHLQVLRWCAREHGTALGRLCMLLLGSHSEAEDLAQETLIAAFKSFTQWQGSGTLRAWLFGIARRLCARHLETRTKRANQLHLVHDSASVPEPEELVLAQARAKMARAALEKVRPTEREALALRYEADLSFREVAQACGVDEATARKRVSRGLARLREIMLDEQV